MFAGDLRLLVPVAIGLAIGVPVAVGVERLLSNVLFVLAASGWIRGKRHLVGGRQD